MSILDAIRREAIAGAVSSRSPFSLRVGSIPASLHAPRVATRTLRIRLGAATALLLTTATMSFLLGHYLS